MMIGVWGVVVSLVHFCVMTPLPGPRFYILRIVPVHLQRPDPPEAVQVCKPARPCL